MYNRIFRVERVKNIFQSQPLVPLTTALCRSIETDRTMEPQQMKPLIDSSRAARIRNSNLPFTRSFFNMFVQNEGHDAAFDFIFGAIEREFASRIERYSELQERYSELQERYSELHKACSIPNKTHPYCSSTRAMMWKDLLEKNRVVQRQPPVFSIPNIVASNQDQLTALESIAFSKEFSKEDSMYTSVQKCLDPIFQDFHDYSVVDTHNKRKILRGMPDLGIFRGQVSPVNLCAFVELKTKDSFSDENHGQALDYLIQMHRYQPGRKFMIGMISSISNNSIIILTYVASHQRSISSPDAERRDYIPQITLHTHLKFSQAISILYRYIERAEYKPPNLKFSEDIGTLERVLGYPRRAMVGVFPAPELAKKEFPHRGEVMAVKVSIRGDRDAFEKEIKVLRRIAEVDPVTAVPSCLPQLVHDNPSRLEFGIMPVGEPLGMSRIATHQDARDCMGDVLDALQWIHERGIVHRDLRADNLIIVSPLAEVRLAKKSGYGKSGFKEFSGRSKVVLIDFDRATSLGEKVIFEGGYICCPPSLLDEVARTQELARAGSDSPSPTNRYSTMTETTVLSVDEDYAVFDYEIDEDGFHSENDTYKERNELTEALFRAAHFKSQYPLEVTKYTPQKSDDLLSFVLLLVNLLFPHTFDAFQYCNIERAHSSEFRRLRSLWSSLRESHIWAPAVHAAEKEDTATLREFLKIFVML
ncbi:hypothetical protein K440DRAFT_642153 [Wilcoxina mikolae CBS 423.85]|nr:hypothetical protein K440DRAFT_642153 [Wilcoxina mikolae CBS 423.85]